MPARPVLLLCAAIAVGALACDPDAWLGGALHFEEIDADEALRRAALAPIHLVQVREPDSDDPYVAAARAHAPDQKLPDVAMKEGSIFVIGRDDRSARRFAARLARAGFARVTAVRGGLAPWLERTPPDSEHAP